MKSTTQAGRRARRENLSVRVLCWDNFVDLLFVPFCSGSFLEDPWLLEVAGLFLVILKFAGAAAQALKMKSRLLLT